MRIHIASSAIARVRGLFGRYREFMTGDVLLLAPCSSIHTFGMKHPIDVAFVDEEGLVCKTFKHLGPNRFLSCSAAVATLERYSVESEDSLEGEVPLDMCYLHRDSWFHVGQRLTLGAIQTLPPVDSVVKYPDVDCAMSMLTPSKGNACLAEMPIEARESRRAS